MYQKTSTACLFSIVAAAVVPNSGSTWYTVLVGKIRDLLRSRDVYRDTELLLTLTASLLMFMVPASPRNVCCTEGATARRWMVATIELDSSGREGVTLRTHSLAKWNEVFPYLFDDWIPAILEVMYEQYDRVRGKARQVMCFLLFLSPQILPALSYDITLQISGTRIVFLFVAFRVQRSDTTRHILWKSTQSYTAALSLLNVEKKLYILYIAVSNPGSSAWQASMNTSAKQSRPRQIMTDQIIFWK